MLLILIICNRDKSSPCKFS